MTKNEDKKDLRIRAEMEKELDEFRRQVKTLEEEKQKLFEQLQRVSADYANFQKRSARQIADSVAYEKKAILRSLLPSLDNFEHVFAGARAACGEAALQKVIEGIQLVYDHMLDALKSHGVEKIEAAGKPFDPEKHEAMMHRAEADKENNIVLEVFQPGYTYQGQVLRPARVIVNKLPEAEEPPFEAETPEEEPEPGENENSREIQDQ